MPTTVTRTIGTQLSPARDYTTIDLWAADLDEGTIYASGDTAVGELYADSPFTTAAAITGGGTIGLAHVHLTAAAGQRHDGTAHGGGVVFQPTASDLIYIEASATKTARISWLRADGATVRGARLRIDSTDAMCNIDHNIVHGTFGDFDDALGIVMGDNGTISCSTHNNIIYNCKHSGPFGTGIGINSLAGGAVDEYQYTNNTVHNIAYNRNDRPVYGISAGNGTVYGYNNIATDTNTTAGGGTFEDFTGTLNGGTHNASSDTTAPGASALYNRVSSTEYVSTVVGSEELLLSATATVRDAGVDISGVTPLHSGMVDYAIDILGNDRTGATTWDIGAHEYELSAGGGTPSGGGVVDAIGEIIGAGKIVTSGGGAVAANAEVVGVGKAVTSGGGSIAAVGELVGAGKIVSGGSGSVVAVGDILGSGKIIAKGGGVVEAIGVLLGTGVAPSVGASTGGGVVSAVAEILGTGKAPTRGGGVIAANGLIEGVGKIVAQGGGSVLGIGVLLGTGVSPVPTTPTGGGSVIAVGTLVGVGKRDSVGGGSVEALGLILGTGVGSPAIVADDILAISREIDVTPPEALENVELQRYLAENFLRIREIISALDGGQAVTGQFISSSGQRITIKNGIITEIA